MSNNSKIFTFFLLLAWEMIHTQDKQFQPASGLVPFLLGGGGLGLEIEGELEDV
jgi:hypothetical protein